MAVYEVEAPPEVFTEREQRARTLEAAALEIEVRGHAKHALMWDYDMSSVLAPANIKGSVCLLGAIGCANGWLGGDNEFPGGSGEAFGPGLSHAVMFNNAEGTTPDEVTSLLRWRAEEIRDGWDA